MIAIKCFSSGQQQWNNRNHWEGVRILSSTHQQTYDYQELLHLFMLLVSLFEWQKLWPIIVQTARPAQSLIPHLAFWFIPLIHMHLSVQSCRELHSPQTQRLKVVAINYNVLFFLFVPSFFTNLNNISDPNSLLHSLVSTL